MNTIDKEVRDNLLYLVYNQKDDYIAGFGEDDEDEDKHGGHRQFECLVALVEDGTITTKEQLSEYGIST